eukprot:2975976-Rhodomonas_salina.2
MRYERNVTTSHRPIPLVLLVSVLFIPAPALPSPLQTTLSPSASRSAPPPRLSSSFSPPHHYHTHPRTATATANANANANAATPPPALQDQPTPRLLLPPRTWRRAQQDDRSCLIIFCARTVPGDQPLVLDLERQGEKGSLRQVWGRGRGG